MKKSLPFAAAMLCAGPAFGGSVRDADAAWQRPGVALALFADQSNSGYSINATQIQAEAKAEAQGRAKSAEDREAEREKKAEERRAARAERAARRRSRR